MVIIKEFSTEHHHPPPENSFVSISWSQPTNVLEMLSTFQAWTFIKSRSRNLAVSSIYNSFTCYPKVFSSTPHTEWVYYISYLWLVEVFVLCKIDKAEGKSSFSLLERLHPAKQDAPPKHAVHVSKCHIHQSERWDTCRAEVQKRQKLISSSPRTHYIVFKN